MVDWVRVSELRAEIGEDDYAEIIKMFLEETDAVIGRLTSDVTAKALESDLHFLKGSALNIGMSSLASICQLGEKKAAAGSTDIDFSEIARVYADSKAMLLSGWDKAQAS